MLVLSEVLIVVALTLNLTPIVKRGIFIEWFIGFVIILIIDHILVRRRPRNFVAFVCKCRFKLIDLSRILDHLAFDHWNYLLLLRNILLS
jgi:hypothetical protein